MTIREIQKITKKIRGFDIDFYFEEKIKSINDFFRLNNLDSCTLGISGGIDSAVVLGLLHEASKRDESPIKKILPISIPIKTYTPNEIRGVTNQEVACYFSKMIFNHFNYQYYEVNLEGAYKDIINNSCLINNKSKEDWCHGQMASVLRTPVLYYHAAILQASGYKSIVVGTTNRDEGAYIGFFGKASDAMVDLQPIADIHKSEVYEVAKKLGIPDEIINRKPQGDVWDYKVDEEMIGAPYWFLEMYQLTIEQKSKYLFSCLEGEEKIQAFKWIDSLRELHKINSHKYKVGSPAHYIDVYKRTLD